MPAGVKCGCGCGRKADSVHHLVHRGQGGDDAYPNLMPLAGSGTTLCHGALQYRQKTWDHVRGEYVTPLAVAAGIRANLRPDQLAYMVAKKGDWWVDLVYPSA